MNPGRVALAAAALLAVSAATLLGAGELLSRPVSRSIGSPPVDFDAQTIRIPTSADQFVVGWFSPGKQHCGMILLLHGIRSDRRQMVGRARLLSQSGYAVLLLDLPAHGESSGERITFGAKEALGVAAAVAFLRSKLPGERLGIIGVSLGAASTVLANLQPAPDAVVIESMYPTIEEAVSNRLAIRLGSAGRALAPLLLWQLPLRAGVSTEDLRPIEHLAGLGAPVLVASGREDKHTTWVETERIFKSAREPKELWVVPGAAHVDLYAFQPKEYERRVFGFLGKFLRNETRQDAGADARNARG
jgi:fermentation-respiration switch protein FrsA (DUF1100 family)